MSRRHNLLTVAVGLLFGAASLSHPAWGAASGPTNSAPNPGAPSSPGFAPHARKFYAIDADNHNVLLNRPGLITLVLGTNEDSQDAARAAGKAVYPFQGRPDFALMVVVDLRDSIAGWVPSIVTTRMRVSLDQEAFELKPYFLKNGNHNNPRSSLHVIPDFSGTVCPQLGWKEGSDDMRVIIFGADGREVQRIDKVGVDDMPAMQEAVRKAIQTQVDIEQAKLSAIGKTPDSRFFHVVVQHPPLVPYTPVAPGKN